MILAAGRGERMRPLTDRVPKALLEVAGKPLIAWHLERLAAAGVTDIVINHAHLGTRIEDALGTGARFGVRIEYSREREALETAGGVAYALPRLGGQPFAVVNADIYCDFDFARLARAATTLDGAAHAAHLVLVPNPPHHPHGDFGLLESEVTDASPRLTYSGIGVYHPRFFADVVHGAKAKLAPLLTAAIGRRALSGERYAGIWVDVGTPQRLTEATRLAGGGT